MVFYLCGYEKVKVKEVIIGSCLGFKEWEFGE